MCEPTTILMVASTLVAAQNAHVQAKTAQNTLDHNAKVADIQAADARERGATEAMLAQRKAGQLNSAQRAAQAAKGLDVGFGTAADIQDQTDFFGASDAATIRNNAGKEAWAREATATGFRAEAAGRNPGMAAAGTLLSGASQVSDKWNTWKKTQG
jgi:hypothetical protein